MLIKDLTVGTPLHNLELLVSKRQIALTKANKPYLNLELTDGKSSISTKIWDNVDSLAWLNEGSVVCITGEVTQYQDKLQLTVGVLSQGKKQKTDFFRWSQFNIEEMWGKIVDVIGNMKEPLPKFILEELLVKGGAIQTAYKKAPAARDVHNNWLGGLLEHVWAMCTMAEAVIPHYQKYQPKLSKDKVMFGLIAHDLCKIVEYEFSEPPFKISLRGQFVPHIPAGFNLVMKTGDMFANKDANFKLEMDMIGHLILAHHGRLEWGSPVVPRSLEALLVHHLDLMDSHMTHAIDCIENKPGTTKGMSEKSFFHGTSYYNYEV